MTDSKTVVEECPRCGDTGWVDCEADPHCGDPSHGTFCTCAVGKERERDD